MYQRDREFGLESEKNIKPILERFFNDELTDTTRWTTYDFKGKENRYELKARRNCYNTYPTTMIPADKVDENLIFVFQFTDGNYYIPYNKETFDTFECKPFRRWRTGTRDKEKDYIYIPIGSLLKID